MALRLETDVFTLVSDKCFVMFLRACRYQCDYDYFVQPVAAQDLRNHGESPHHHTHTYNAMADDVSAFMAEHRLDQVVVMGHSM